MDVTDSGLTYGGRENGEIRAEAGQECCYLITL